MTSRHIGDYDLDTHIEKDRAVSAVSDAETFVDEVEQWLHKHNLL